jgi:hypothetical protein
MMTTTTNANPAFQIALFEVRQELALAMEVITARSMQHALKIARFAARRELV